MRHELTKEVPVTRFSEKGNVLAKLLNLRDEIEKRAFQIFLNNGCRDDSALRDWVAAENELLMPIAVEIVDKDNELLVSATLPGFNENEIEVHVEPTNNLFTAKHEETEEEKTKKVLFSEYRKNEVMRNVPLPTAVEPEKAKAVLENGIVRVTLTKEAEKGKKIHIARAA